MNRLIKQRIDGINNPEAIRYFFNLLKVLIDENSLAANDERLVLYARNNNRKRLSVTINGRLVLYIKNGDDFGLMINNENLEVIENIIHKLNTNFKKQVPNASLINFQFETLKENINLLKPLWLKSCADYLPAQGVSQYRNNNIEELYQLAQQEDLLDKYITMEPFHYTHFNHIVEGFTDHIKSKDSLLQGFEVQDTKDHWVWISDSKKLIGPDGFCHYELIYRKKYPAKIWVELHFQKPMKQAVKNLLGDGQHEKYFWNKEHADELSLAVREPFSFEDPQLLSRLEKSFFELDLSFGEVIRNIIINMRMIKLKEDFINWFVKNDGSNANYFKLQFGSNLERLRNEINDYEEKYNAEFTSKLFNIDPSNYHNDIEALKTNLYNKATEFNKYSEAYSNSKPRAILGKNNYIKFLHERFADEAASTGGIIHPPSFESTSLNQILYGPPGTGKTYNSINKALEIINDDEVKALAWKDRKAVKELFDKKVGEGQIVFTTFHQNMSYEDFIEGIKPETTKNEDVIYKVEPGIFKKICLRASEKKYSRNFDESYSAFVEQVLATDSFTLETPIHKRKFKVQINSNETAVAIPETEKATEMGVTKEMVKDYVLNGNIRDWKSYTISIGEYFKTHFPIDIQNSKNPNKKFVIIIDEINRGNVSKIFGELITLIEESKREGMPEAITAKLPYSKINNDFSVPKNVYIVGTMNTADRSVEALDTALRRRFDFVEMMPQYDICEKNDPRYQWHGIFVFDILKIINDRLEILLGRDHLIGHSFFLLGEKEVIEVKLVAAFYKNIIPLLQEYFYGDYNKIGLVLGSGFVKKNKVEKHDALFADNKLFNGHEYISKDSYQYNIPILSDDGFQQAIQILMNRKNSENNE